MLSQERHFGALSRKAIPPNGELPARQAGTGDLAFFGKARLHRRAGGLSKPRTGLAIL